MVTVYVKWNTRIGLQNSWAGSDVTGRRGVICDPDLLQVHFTADSKSRLCLLVFCRIECHAIKPGIKILNPKLYPPITNACAAQKTASGFFFLHWLAVRNFTRFNFPRRRSQLKYKHKLPHLTLILAVALFLPPPPAEPGRNSVLYGEAPPESGTFFRLQINNSVRISLVEVYERRGKSVNSVWKKT